MEGEIQILSDGATLDFKEYTRQQRAPKIIDSKGLEKEIDKIKERAKRGPPGKNHPWRTYAVTVDKRLAEEAKREAGKGFEVNASIGSYAPKPPCSPHSRVAS